MLAFSFYFALRYSYRQSLPTEEFAYACDPFGYLRMAKEIRHGFAHGVWPEFKLESTQTRLLINFMKQENLAVSRWEEVVAPHGHHYFPVSGYVGVQYPPGTGLVLSMFPQGEAVYRLNRIVVFVFGLIGIAVLAVAVWKRAWVSIGLAILALNLGLLVLARISTSTFSINAVMPPILLTCLFSLVALRLKVAGRDKLALASSLVAGLSLGLAVLIRLPSFLLLPGFFILLWPGFDRLRTKALPVALVAGVVVIGIIPVLINQEDVAGAWYLPTYASVDAAPPTFETLINNLHYFLLSGPATVDNWALLFALLGFCGFLILYSKSDSEAVLNRLGLSGKRLALTALLLWLVPICYFLTHAVTGAHYMIPAVLATITLGGLGALGMEITRASRIRFDKRQILSWVALALILSPGLAIFSRVWFLESQPNQRVRANTHPPILLPAELVDEKAWIWADLLTGSLWYYANKPAFKIQFTDEETRSMLFRFVFDRGERQYIVQDSEAIKKYMDEITQLGGKLEMRGKIDGQPYFLIVWPNNGPASAQVKR